MNLQMRIYLPTDPPHVSAEASRVAVDMNKTMSLSCDAHSLPKPSFQWFHYGTPLNQSNARVQIVVVKVENSYRSVLNLSDVTKSDLGQYFCVAQNIFGNSSVGIAVTVKSKYMYCNMSEYKS